MDQGEISNFKCYYLRRTFAQLLEENENPDSMKEFWKNYNILQAFNNIVEAWDEVKESSMRGVWSPLLPNMLNEFIDEPISGPETVCNDIIAQAVANHFEGMELSNINEVLEAGNEELSNEDLIEMNIQNLSIVDQIEDAVPVQITQSQISKGLKLIDEAMDIFLNSDHDETRSFLFSKTIKEATKCYQSIYDKNKKDLV